ncbi:MAG: hypothetical protein GY798_23300 [Hyphomicrobiales bacterium]|nr:hypothetical protein [Hyphomicrobiales bacterium]MCP4960473.1 hypothetical protein [Actinomycetes bacterium]
MRVQANGKVRRSSEEWREILDRFERSGISQREFCRKEGLPLGSFSKWKRRMDGSEMLPGMDAGRFVELTETPSRVTGLSAGEMELSLPGGVQLRWRV